MRIQGMLLVASLTLLAGCGSAVGTASDELGDSSGAGQFDIDSTCGAIASEYVSARQDAVICDPSASDPCSAQRPLGVVAVEGDKRTITDLCYTAYVGYVNPTRTARLDEILAGYSAAGCKIAYCPGPSPRQPACNVRSSGPPTCW